MIKSDEAWKDILDNSNYQISNYGNVRSKDRSIEVNRYGHIHTCNYKGKLLKIHSQYGYKVVQIKVNGKVTTFSISRLVYSHFVGKLIKDLIIDHIDEDTYNNYYSNLQQITKRDNANRSIDRTATSSKYIGVTWIANRKTWQARIKIDGIRIQLGTFDIEEDARDAYLKAKLNVKTPS